MGQSNYPRSRKRDGPDACHILIVVCHKSVAECEQHDEPKNWAKRRDEKRGCDFDTAPNISPEEVDGHAYSYSRQQPDIIQPVRRRDVPSWIDKRQLGRPKNFAEIKPHSSTRDENPFNRTKKGKHRVTRSLMIAFPPNCE